MKFGFNICRGGRLECLKRDSFRTSAELPLYFESSSSRLSQTHLRMSLGVTL